jgi:hypothetical protein
MTTTDIGPASCAADSGGIHAVVPLAALAAHPENPCTDLRRPGQAHGVDRRAGPVRFPRRHHRRGGFFDRGARSARTAGGHITWRIIRDGHGYTLYLLGGIS